MTLSSILCGLLLSVGLVSSNILSDDQITTMLGKVDLEQGWKTLKGIRQQRSLRSWGKTECQESHPLGFGASYSGSMNVTSSGRTCKAWALQGFSFVGDHNFCRNPLRQSGGVWCFTTDPDMYMEYCNVPRCPTRMKVLDFSADSDGEPDSNGEFTGASLNVGVLPESFTICVAYMVEAFFTVSSAQMVRIIDLGNFGDAWYIKMNAQYPHTIYEVYFGNGFMRKQGGRS